MYDYKAFVTKVYDGDTITVDIDLGFNFFLKGEKIRLFGINAPERKRPTLDEGRSAQAALADVILEKEVVIKILKDKGKFSRWIGVVYLDDRNINEWMIENGHAIEVNY